jgi:hypothetical protein
MAVSTLSARPLPTTDVIIGRGLSAAGSLTVALPAITEDSLVFVTNNAAAATGALRVVITAGTGFVVTSLVGAGDSGVIAWMVILIPVE